MGTIMPFITNNEIIITLRETGTHDENFLKKYKKVINYLSKNPTIYEFESKSDHINGSDVFIITVKTSWAVNIELLMKQIRKLEYE